MKLRFLGGRFQGRLAEISGDSFAIGRGQSNDLVLDQDGVSRYHCRFVREGESWFVQDLESTNGVRLNGQRITEKRKINPGDRIGISGNLLLFTDTDAEPSDSALFESMPEESAPADSVRRETPEPRAESAEAEESEPFPWGRTILLVVALLVFVVLGIDHVLTQLKGPTEGPLEAHDSSTASEQPDLWSGTDTGTSDVPSEDASAAADDSRVAGGNEDAVEADADEPSAAERQADETKWHAVIRSVPTGAEAWVDDESVGRTPAVVTLPPGRHRLRLERKGYEQLQRLIDKDRLPPKEPFVLRQKPGTVLVKSAPSGAAVLHGRQLLGSTPLVIASLPAGDHPLTVVEHGYEPKDAMITVSDVRGAEKTVELAAVLGTLEIVTFPPGCEVRVGGVRKGETQPLEGHRESAPLVVSRLLAGRHLVKVSHPLGGERTGPVAITAGRIARKGFRFWFPSHRVALKNGHAVHGMLLKRDENEVTILDRHNKPQRFEAGAVETVEEVPAERVREMLKGMQGRNGGATLQGIAVDGRDLQKPAFRLEAAEFDEEVRSATVGELRNQFETHIVRARGSPSKIIASERLVHVWLGNSIHCELGPGMLPAVREAKESGTPLVVQGRVASCSNDEIVLVKCKIVSGGSW